MMMKKIFYGVQGTGNGHITRARVMAKALYEAGFEVTFQFTGRPADQYFDMEIFGDYQIRSGLTFNTSKGQVSYLKTALQSQPLSFIRDIKTLDLSRYDVVISDFEPVTAWAAKRQHKTVMGLHWHHFGQPILPPIIETPAFPAVVQAHKIVVYLPFEDCQTVINHLAPFENFEFHVYSPQLVPSRFSHVICKPLSREGFQRDVYDCGGIISNAGFELASEALQLGKKILVKPLHAQMEQISNAAALKQLGYGHTMFDIDSLTIAEWLHHPHAIRVTYPDVAQILVQWLKDGSPQIDQAFAEQVWQEVAVIPLNA